MNSKVIIFFGLIIISNSGIGIAIISTIFEYESMDSTKTCHIGFFDHLYWCTGNGRDAGNLETGIICLSIFLILIDIGFTVVYYTDMKKIIEQLELRSDKK